MSRTAILVAMLQLPSLVMCCKCTRKGRVSRVDSRGKPRAPSSAGSAHLIPPRYNGRPISIERLWPFSSISRLKKSDLIKVGWSWVPYEGAVDYHVVSYPSGAMVIKSKAKGKTYPIAVRIVSDEDFKGKVTNPLNDMSSEELRYIRFVSLWDWNGDILESVSKLSLGSVCLEIKYMTSETVKTGRFLPDVRCLMIDGDVSTSRTFISSMMKNTQLRIFYNDGANSGSIDAALLARHTELQYLKLRSWEVTNASRLGSLTRLKVLSSDEHISSLDFIKRLKGLVAASLTSGRIKKLPSMKGLKKLKVLDLSYNRLNSVSELRGAAALKHLDISNNQITDIRTLDSLPRLRNLIANWTTIERLPKGRMPGLKRFELLKSKVSEGEMRRFRKLNPKVRLIHNWKMALLDRVAGSDALKLVRRFEYEEPMRKKVIRTIATGKVAVRRIVRRLNGNMLMRMCGCIAKSILSFYRKGVLIASVDVYRESIGWRQWPGDVYLDAESMSYIKKLIRTPRILR